MAAFLTIKGTGKWAPLVIRVVLGIIFIAHGSQKLFGAFDGPGIAGFAGGLDKMGAHPAILWAWIVTLVEFLGGIGLVFGFLTSIASAAILINMVVAVAMVHGKNGFFLNHRGFEYNLALIAMALSLIFSGPGALSIDGLIGRRFPTRE